MQETLAGGQFELTLGNGEPVGPTPKFGLKEGREVLAVDTVLKVVLVAFRRSIPLTIW